MEVFQVSTEVCPISMTGDGLALQNLPLCPAIIFNLIKWCLKKWKQTYYKHELAYYYLNFMRVILFI